MTAVIKKYCEIKDCMKPGDIIAFSGKDLISEVIKLVTEGQVSHVGIILAVGLPIEGDPDGNCFNLVAESTEEGVRIISLSGLQRAYNGKIWWLPLSGESREKLESNFSTFCKSVIEKDGYPYDYSQAIMEGLQELSEKRNDFLRVTGKSLVSPLISNGIELINTWVTDDRVTGIKSIADFGKEFIQALVDNRRLKSITEEAAAKRYFCSELATCALQVVGVLPNTDNIDPE